MKHTVVGKTAFYSHDGIYKAIQKMACVVLIFVFIQLMNQFLIRTGSALEREVAGRYDPRFVAGVFQQIIQAGIGIMLFRLIFKAGVKELGINLKNGRISLNYFLFFALLWSSIIILYLLGTYFLLPDSWASLKSIELPPTNTMISRLLLQSFFPGFGEEILFRGFFISLLSALVFTRYQARKDNKLGLIVVSSLYFALAHVYFTVTPFRLTHVDYLQLVTAFGCGVFYAAAYLKTGSLLAPFLAHNFSNTSATICGFIISAL